MDSINNSQFMILLQSIISEFIIDHYIDIQLISSILSSNLHM